MSRRKFLCLDCNVDTGKAHEHYMLKDEVWLSVVDSIVGMLCIDCIEKRLGRKLNKTDFNDSHVNNPKLYPMSDKLRSRLKRRAPLPPHWYKITIQECPICGGGEEYRERVTVKTYPMLRYESVYDECVY